LDTSRQKKDRAVQDGAVASLRPRPGNARTHSKKQIRQIADSIRQFGFTNPVPIGEDGGIIAGRGRVPRLAAASNIRT
jgi:ParB-like chromosome segregation protein Spo0J